MKNREVREEKSDLRAAMFLARLATTVEIYLKEEHSPQWLTREYKGILEYYETGVNPLGKDL